MGRSVICVKEDRDIIGGVIRGDIGGNYNGVKGNLSEETESSVPAGRVFSDSSSSHSLGSDRMSSVWTASLGDLLLMEESTLSSSGLFTRRISFLAGGLREESAEEQEGKSS